MFLVLPFDLTPWSMQTHHVLYSVTSRIEMHYPSWCLELVFVTVENWGKKKTKKHNWNPTLSPSNSEIVLYLSRVMHADHSIAQGHRRRSTKVGPRVLSQNDGPHLIISEKALVNVVGYRRRPCDWNRRERICNSITISHVHAMSKRMCFELFHWRLRLQLT